LFSARNPPSAADYATLIRPTTGWSRICGAALHAAPRAGRDRGPFIAGGPRMPGDCEPWQPPGHGAPGCPLSVRGSSDGRPTRPHRSTSAPGLQSSPRSGGLRSGKAPSIVLGCGPA